MLTSTKDTRVVQPQAAKNTSVVQNISQKCKMITLILVIQGANVLGSGSLQRRVFTESTLDKILEQKRIQDLTNAFQSILNTILKAAKNTEQIPKDLNALAEAIDATELKSGVQSNQPKDVFNQKIVQYIELYRLSLFAGNRADTEGLLDAQRVLLSFQLNYLGKLSSEGIINYKGLIEYLTSLKAIPTNEHKTMLGAIKEKLLQALKVKSTPGKLKRDQLAETKPR
jgi:hypothetical protein